jgi:hypothetical protein
MRLRPVVGLVLLLLVGLTVLGLGCLGTGGGWFVNEEDGARVTFGFTVQLIDEDGSARGQFQLVDHGSSPPTRIHGEFTAAYEGGIEDFSGYEGTCSINGDDGHTFLAGMLDVEPEPKVAVYLDGGVQPAYLGVLGGGTIRGHEH